VQTSEGPGRTISARGATGVGVASAIGALSGYVVLLVASRTLDTARNAEFLTFWSLLFFFFGVLGGIQNETTRAVSAAGVAPAGAARGVRLLPVSMLAGFGLALVVGATSPLWGRSVLGASWPVLVAALCAAVVAFTGHSVLCGTLAGALRWGPYSLAVGAEATVRLVAVVAVAVVAESAVGYEVAAALAAATWVVLLLVDRRFRTVTSARADVGAGPFLRNVGHATVATAASAAIVVGFTVLLRVTSPPAEFLASAPFVLAISVTRAPLLVPLTAYQGVAITHFLARRSQGLRALAPVAGVIAGVAVLASAAAWLVGPWLMRTMFGPAYDLPGVQLGLLTLAGGGLALLTLTGAVTLAVGRHRAYAGGWLLATAVCAVALMLPLSLPARGITSLLVGPLVGVAVHAATIARAASGDRSAQ
jgi:O-antigen/teichoic acid export membrane protein